MKLWCERPLPETYRHLVDPEVALVGSGADTPHDPIASARTATAIVAGAKMKYDDAVLARVPELCVIARTGIGFDNIDLDAATARGIAVCNAPDGPTLSTAEHTIALLFAVAKRLPRNARLLREGKRVDYFNVNDGFELHGCTLGLVGLGRIGSRVAQLARGIGLRVIAHDPFVSPQRAGELGIELKATLDALLAESDFVSLHVPLTAQTRHLLNGDRLRQMKRGAVLLNCARGGLIDEAALLVALDSGHLSGAGLDVFEQEPPPPDSPLLHRDDIVATPHIAPATLAGKERLWRIALQQAVTVLRGQKPEHLVNTAVWDRRLAGKR